MKIHYDSLNKFFTLGIFIVFPGVCFYPATAQPVKQAFSSSQGNWLYVGGAGPGNYTKIQDAIDNASTGDTIYVYQGTYHEALIIDTWSLTIIGENRYTTIIETNTSEVTITIQPHDPDVKALLRMAVVGNIPIACNRATADFMISSPLMDGEYDPLVPDYDDIRKRPITTNK